jgi:hypothetical protein
VATRDPVALDTAAAPIQVARSFWIAGEQMRWELSAHGILGAEVVLAVGDPGVFAGERAIIIKSRVEGAGMVKMVIDLSEEVTTWLAIDRAAPLQRHVHARIGKKEATSEVHFDAGGYVRTTRRGDRTPYLRRGSVPAGTPVHDTHSILGLLRSWSAEPGAHAYFHAISEGRLRRHLVRFSGYETLHTHLGRYPVIRLDGVVRKGLAGTGKGSPYTLWISNDADRMPLRMVVPTQGIELNFELIDYHRPPR